jgi:hypothetical protein
VVDRSRAGWDGRGMVNKGRGAHGTAEDKELQLEGTVGRAGVHVVCGARDVVERDGEGRAEYRGRSKELLPRGRCGGGERRAGG